jgi:hypothetical protein
MACADNNIVTALCTSDRVRRGGLSPYLATDAAAQRASQKADFERLAYFFEPQDSPSSFITSFEEQQGNTCVFELYGCRHQNIGQLSDSVVCSTSRVQGRRDNSTTASKVCISNQGWPLRFSKPHSQFMTQPKFLSVKLLILYSQAI